MDLSKCSVDVTLPAIQKDDIYNAEEGSSSEGNPNPPLRKLILACCQALSIRGINTSAVCEGAANINIVLLHGSQDKVWWSDPGNVYQLAKT